MHTTGTATKAALCSAYGAPLTYSGTKDTHETVRQAKVKNATFHKIGCW